MLRRLVLVLSPHTGERDIWKAVGLRAVVVPVVVPHLQPAVRTADGSLAGGEDGGGEVCEGEGGVVRTGLALVLPVTLQAGGPALPQHRPGEGGAGQAGRVVAEPGEGQQPADLETVAGKLVVLHVNVLRRVV